MSERRRGAVAFGLAAAAVVWSGLVIVAAFAFPAYAGETCAGGTGGPTVCYENAETLFEVNGWGVIELLAGFAAVVLLAALALQRKCARGSRWAEQLAWALIAALAAFSLIGALSIGMFVFPAVVLLCLSATLTPSRKPLTP